jgi:hypothetical protein
MNSLAKDLQVRTKPFALIGKYERFYLRTDVLKGSC